MTLKQAGLLLSPTTGCLTQLNISKCLFLKIPKTLAKTHFVSLIFAPVGGICSSRNHIYARSRNGDDDPKNGLRAGDCPNVHDALGRLIAAREFQDVPAGNLNSLQRIYQGQTRLVPRPPVKFK